MAKTKKKQLKLRQVEENLKWRLSRAIEKKTGKRVGSSPYARFIIEEGCMAIRHLGSGSRLSGVVYLEPEYWKNLNDDQFLDYLAFCLVNNQQLSEVGKRLYG